jgi:RNA polymerase sigma-70 factor (ECF subfamily)
MTDEKLMQRFANGDEQAFAPLFDRYKDRLYRYLKRLCGNDGIAEELYQDVWERLIKRRKSFNSSHSFATYLFSIAHNRLVDHFRSVSSRSFQEFQEGSYLGDSGSVEHQVFSLEQVQRFMQVLEALPPPQREIFVLHEETSMTLTELAETIGIKPETAKSRLRFALVNLRKGMEGYE